MLPSSALIPSERSSGSTLLKLYRITCTCLLYPAPFLIFLIRMHTSPLSYWESLEGPPPSVLVLTSWQLVGWTAPHWAALLRFRLRVVLLCAALHWFSLLRRFIVLPVLYSSCCLLWSLWSFPVHFCSLVRLCTLCICTILYSYRTCTFQFTFGVRLTTYHYH